MSMIILEVGNTNISDEACTTIYPSALSLSKVNQHLPPAPHNTRSWNEKKPPKINNNKVQSTKCGHIARKYKNVM